MPEPSVAPTNAATLRKKPSQSRRFVQVGLTYAWFVGALLVSAGHLDWTRGWISVVVWVGCMTAIGLVVQRRNPELMAERARWRRKDTKPFDKIFMAVYFPLVLLHPVVAGLDAARFRWTSMPFGFVYLGVAMFVASSLLIGWVLVVNPHAETSVRIQADRGHAVVTSGPYQYVRHPMYVGISLMSLASPFIWGSMWALAIGVLMVLLFVWRASREDETLRRELPGYEEYAARTPYRLIPGLW